MKAGHLNKGFALGPIIAPSHPTQREFEQSLTQKYALGARWALDDGRVYHYARAGAAALVAGDLLQSPNFGGSSATVQTDLTPTAAAIGAINPSVTLSTDAATLNQYADGWCSVSDGSVAQGFGTMYKIKGNDAAGAGASMVLHLERPLTTAWTSSTRLSIMTNPYNLVVQAPVTTPTGFLMGVSNIAVDINYFCWLQTWGMCNVLVKTALTMGTNVLMDVSVAGASAVDDGALVNTVVGRAGLVVATTDCGMIYLMLSP